MTSLGRHHVLAWSVASENWLENWPLGVLGTRARLWVKGLRVEVIGLLK